jgi:hypothetical protein
MATLQTYIDYPEVKPIHKTRYADTGYFVMWANQLLEELQERGFLSTTIKEVGAIVDKKVWIIKPSDLVTLEKVYDPLDLERIFRVEDVNDKFRLLDVSFDYDEDDWDSADSFGNYEVSSMLCDLEEYAENALENYLCYFSTGSLAGNGIILSGNDASVYDSESETWGTTIYFLHDLSSRLDCCDIGTAYFIPPGQYLMLKYHSLITQIDDEGDEFPIPDDCEARLVPTWLRWCCERETQSTSQETIYWQGEVNKLLYGFQANRSARVNPAKGRRLVGLENPNAVDKEHVSWDTLYDDAG